MAATYFERGPGRYSKVFPMILLTISIEDFGPNGVTVAVQGRSIGVASERECDTAEKIAERIYTADLPHTTKNNAPMTMIKRPVREWDGR
jgi:hypothetical protein